MRGFIKDVVKDNMGYMESAYRDVMVDNVANSWDKMEELESQETLEFNWTGKGSMTVSLSFNPIFHRSVMRVTWCEKPTSWAFIVLHYDGEWEMHVACQGGESMVEEICEELIKEANR